MEGFSPNALAVAPDSNAPISFDEPIKIPFTAETLPRILSGVANCKTVCRMTTLTLSKAPVRNKKKKAIQMFSDKPNKMVDSPNAPTDRNKFLPAFLVGGL